MRDLSIYCPLCAEPCSLLYELDEAGRRWHFRCARRALAIMPARVVGDQLHQENVNG